MLQHVGGVRVAGTRVYLDQCMWLQCVVLCSNLTLAAGEPELAARARHRCWTVPYVRC